MRRAALVCVSLLALTLALVWRGRSLDPDPEHTTKDTARAEPSPVCPWRQPERDLFALFPAATTCVLETRVVTSLTAEIQKQLGRLMHPDENPLRIHRVTHHGQTAGSVLVTRVKGEHGGIEIVMGVETNGSIRRVLVQSQREPAEVATAITNAAWLGSFTGKNARSPLRVGADLPPVPEAARLSAEAIATGVRDQLTVLSFAELSRTGGPAPKPHH
jgi:hypothetical protein